MPRFVTLATATVVVTITGVARLVENVTDALQMKGAALLTHEAVTALLVTLTDEWSVDAANTLAVLSQTQDTHTRRPEPKTQSSSRTKHTHTQRHEPTTEYGRDSDMYECCMVVPVTGHIALQLCTRTCTSR